jgi:hypothetical protein
MASDKTPKWQMVENVVAAIERVRASVPGIEVIQKAQVPKAAFPDETRDVDVLVKVPVQGRVLQLGIEVKDEARRIAEDEFGTLLDIKNDLQLDRYCVVSTSGFTEAARAKAARNGIELTTLNASDGSPFFGAPPGELVRNRRVDLLSINAEGPPEVLAKLHGVRVDAIQVIAADKRQRPLMNVIAVESNAWVNKGMAEGRDGEELSWQLTFTPEVQLVAAGEILDQLVSFDLRVRFHWDSVHDTRFELAGWLISTWEVDGPDGRLQVTSVAVPTPENPELRQIHVSVGPAKPLKQKIEGSKLTVS